MAVGDSFTPGADGTNVEQRLYKDNDSYMDEWYIRYQYYSTVNIYYDMGYCVRYGLTKEEAAEKLDGYMREVAEIFRETFNLKISYTVSYYESQLDKCKGEVTEANLDEVYGQGGYSDRSSVISEIKNTFESDATTTNLYVSGHRIINYVEKEDGSIDEIKNRSCASGNVVLIIGLNMNLPSDEYDYKAKRGLLHELIHQYEIQNGLYDHYHEKDPKTNLCKNKEICSHCGDNDRPPECVMGIDDYANGELLICEPCKQEVFEHLKDHHCGEE